MAGTESLDMKQHPDRVTLYHGTRASHAPGDLIEPLPATGADDQDLGSWVYLSPDLDEAIWTAELETGEGHGRVYVVEPTGPIADVSDRPSAKTVAHPVMSWRSGQPLRVLSEVLEWAHYHGTRADLRPGELVEPGHTANFGAKVRSANHVYFTRTLDAAIWGAELAAGEGPGRIYIVEPTGPIEDDPNLTDAKFRGNPTKSFRSRYPLRVTGEIQNWRGHPPETVRAMKDGVERLNRAGVEPIDE